MVIEDEVGDGSFEERLQRVNSNGKNNVRQTSYEHILKGIVDQTFPDLGPGAVAGYAVNARPDMKPIVEEYISRQSLLFRLVTRAHIRALRKKR